ncbi:MAG: hypothetical protein NTU53_15790 [Planctomycetota bacterium]|nr:hypothetical protein [Planctomycetota bacterium]
MVPLPPGADAAPLPLRWRGSGQWVLMPIVITPLGYRLRRRGKLLYRQPTYLSCIDATAAVAAYVMLLLGRSAGVGGIALRARGSGAALD